MSDDVLYEKDRVSHIARVTLNRPAKLNAMTLEMYDRIVWCLDDVAEDDDIKVVILSGAGENFTAGVDMNEVYGWYGPPNGADGKKRRPSQRRRLVVDRRTSRVYDRVTYHPKVTITAIRGFALGGGLEFLMGSDISVVGDDAKVGMPATRYLGPVLGDLHLFFHRLGPVLTRDLLLTGRIAPAGELASRGIFTRFVPAADVHATAEELAVQVARMPADGIVIAKESYRLVEQSMGMALSEVCSYLLHAYGTNLQFEDDEFNFVKSRSEGELAQTFDKADQFYS
ncbi:enoyl-CoA hydratase/isomerase family protein [Dactylosporangium sp. AC04546]|uniref:enoyl-CoA hydratase/isomerase family protein n=1 Tax=Dactylosporangium sp. AC04546 TaxID=2862460 RepID=UPI001EDF8015|nr:enoyl-CoA hydratase/isomerase family protein [Dactylosporangium sp. AC04546]WVK86954.1 enoyl-CoA hydratase/isomerase family protein [Dactylosporangium sp. AC04546]